MAMRCSFSDRGGGAPWLLLLAACVTTTTVSYVPSADRPRLTLDAGGRTLAQFVGVECERLAAAGRDSGAAVARVALDSAGTAVSAEILTSSGDARVDGIVGAIAAQLRLDGRPASATTAVRASWRCSGDGGATLVRVPEPDAS